MYMDYCRILQNFGNFAEFCRILWNFVEFCGNFVEFCGILGILRILWNFGEFCEVLIHTIITIVLQNDFLRPIQFHTGLIEVN